MTDPAAAAALRRAEGSLGVDAIDRAPAPPRTMCSSASSPSRSTTPSRRSTPSRPARRSRPPSTTGDPDRIRDVALAAAAGYRAGDQPGAAIDACFVALAARPDDPAVAPGPGRPVPRSWLARAGRREAGPARPIGAPDRRRGHRTSGCARSPRAACPTSLDCAPSAPDPAHRRGAGTHRGSPSGGRGAVGSTGSRCYTRRTMPGAYPLDPRPGAFHHPDRHRHHGAADLLAVQPDPRDPSRPPRHRRQRPVRRLPAGGGVPARRSSPTSCRRAPSSACSRSSSSSSRSCAGRSSGSVGSGPSPGSCRRPIRGPSTTSPTRSPAPPPTCPARATARSSSSSARPASRRSPRPA